jgi:hypothetical protein
MGAPMSQRVTPKKASLFLTALADLGHVGQAAKRTGITVRTWYRHRREDATFAAAWEQALGEAMDTVLEPEAIRRAVHGVLKPVYQGGKRVGYVREYSDTLLIFLLKGGKPEKYRERAHLTVEGEMTLQLEERTRQANDRIARLRRVGPDTLPA